MRSKIKIITSIIIWFLWFIFFLSYSSLSPADIPIPTSQNPFTILKWILWDNALLNGIYLLWIIAASSVTNVYTKVFNVLWEEN